MMLSQKKHKVEPFRERQGTLQTKVFSVLLLEWMVTKNRSYVCLAETIPSGKICENYLTKQMGKQLRCSLRIFPPSYSQQNS